MRCGVGVRADRSCVGVRVRCLSFVRVRSSAQLSLVSFSEFSRVIFVGPHRRWSTARSGLRAAPVTLRRRRFGRWRLLPCAAAVAVALAAGTAADSERLYTRQESLFRGSQHLVLPAGHAAGGLSGRWTGLFEHLRERRSLSSIQVWFGLPRYGVAATQLACRPVRCDSLLPAA